MNISFDFENTSTVREGKGKSLILFPESFVLIDLETTGLDPYYDDIIEIGAIKVVEGSPVDSFSFLINPGYPLPSFITDLTGITDEMLSGAPSLSEIFDSFLSFIGDNVVVAHNAHFDVNFIFDQTQKLGKPVFSNDLVDTLRLARRILPNLEHHRLPDLISYYGISVDTCHRALDDCKSTLDVFYCLKDDAVKANGSLDAFYLSAKKKRNDFKAADYAATTDVFDVDNPLYGKLCVFTGTLDKLTRAQAAQIVLNLGGLVGDSVTKKTNYLILGNNDYKANIKDGKSSKQKKAEELKVKGFDIDIMPESVFYDMIFEDDN